MIQSNETFTNVTGIMNNTTEDTSTGTNTMGIVHSVIASIGIVTNLTVVVVFLNLKKLKQKIPNICIINQVGYIFQIGGVCVVTIFYWFNC